MSKNRNRKRLEKVEDNKVYNILQKGYKEYCVICAKRAGRYGATCGPVRWYPKYKRGFINPHKGLVTWQVREYRTWKYNRKTQWKQ